MTADPNNLAPVSNSAKIGGHLLVECLVAQGVTHAFGVPGESYLAVLDGFHLQRDHIQFIINRQEGGAAYMAEAHGKLTGRPGVCFVTRGPGATNASVGVHTAYQDSTPMVLFVGDVASEMRDREGFQEVNFLSFFGPSTGGMAKRVERIDDVRRIPEYVARAFATAMNGRPGPVVLILPEDMLAAVVPANGEGVLPAVMPRVDAVQAWSDPGRLRELRELLLQAKKPFVIAGGGGWTHNRPRPCSVLPKTGSCRLAMRSVFRTLLIIFTRSTRATWALASTPNWPPNSRKVISSSPSAHAWAR